MIKNLKFLKYFKIYFIISTLLLCSCSKNNEDSEIINYKKLDNAVKHKKEELTQYFEIIHTTLNSISAHGPLIKAFDQLNLIFLSHKNKTKLSDIHTTFQEIDKTILESYLNRFMIFNDLLFINLEGDVFYTLKKEKPLMENIFSSKYNKTILSKNLKEDPYSIAIDFDTFSNDETAAFFVYPVVMESKLLGWCAFKFLASNLDTLFSVEKNIGTTGEVFLVNENSYMLTNSSFTPEDSVLKLHLSNENISSKFSEGIGHKEIIDYRGYRSITSFEVCSIFNINWLLIAKMDYAEILTDDYILNSNLYYNFIRSQNFEYEDIYLKNKPHVDSINEVNLDQFKRISENGELYTHGISTCTGVLITLPGRFSYLAHVSAYDLIYGGENTDLIGNILKRIYKFEIPDHLIRELKVYIISPQINFTKDLIDILIENRLMTSQIYIIKNNNAEYVNIYHDLGSNQTYMEWKLFNKEVPVFQSVKSVPNISDLIRKMKS